MSWHVDESGCWVFRGHLTAEQGAAVARALDAARDRAFEETRGEPQQVEREIEREQCKIGFAEPIAQRRADALERVARAYLAGPEIADSVPYQQDVLGDALVYSSFLLPITFLTYEDTKEDFGTVALMYGEVVLLNAGINGLVKGLTTRNRPYVYDVNSPAEEKYKTGARHSFYSGHTSFAASNSFFTARVFSEYLTTAQQKL